MRLQGRGGPASNSGDGARSLLLWNADYVQEQQRVVLDLCLVQSFQHEPPSRAALLCL